MWRPFLFLFFACAGVALPATGQTWLNLALATSLPWEVKGFASFESRWSPSEHSAVFLDLALRREVWKGLSADGQLRLLYANHGSQSYGPERRLAFRLIHKRALSDRLTWRMRGMIQHACALPEPFNDEVIAGLPASEALRVRTAFKWDLYNMSGQGAESVAHWQPEVNAEWFWRRRGGDPFVSSDLRIRAELHWRPASSPTFFVGYQGEWRAGGGRNPGSDVIRVGGVWHCR